MEDEHEAVASSSDAPLVALPKAGLLATHPTRLCSRAAGRMLYEAVVLRNANIAGWGRKRFLKAHTVVVIVGIYPQDAAPGTQRRVHNASSRWSSTKDCVKVLAMR